MLEAKAAFAEINLPCDARIDHPLQRAVHRRAADALVFAADEINEIVGAEVPLLAEENVEDLLALAGTLAAFGLEAIDGKWKVHLKVKGSKVKGHKSCQRLQVKVQVPSTKCR